MGIIRETIEGDRVYLDANIFIYALEAYPAYANVLAELFDAIDNGEILGVTSELTIAEVLIKPLAEGNFTLQNAYLDAIQSSDTLLTASINRDTLIEAAKIRASNPAIRMPDAIHAATAKIIGCKTIITNDRRFQAATGVKVALLSDMVSRQP